MRLWQFQTLLTQPGSSTLWEAAVVRWRDNGVVGPPEIVTTKVNRGTERAVFHCKTKGTPPGKMGYSRERDRPPGSVVEAVAGMTSSQHSLRHTQFSPKDRIVDELG